ncbi:hypothetical protein RTE98_00300 [Stutzerimonas frequens]|uniref:hypothetical protein n=1 Tax=Stutzerimonas frequens TaxID=2968969 RepID=UPI002934D63F|nr:hypothetical protein [Stutzerimonas frequens]WOC79004.1 hypothetical protein RTE98_00300 [Stutzerimonas frequens]
MHSFELAKLSRELLAKIEAVVVVLNVVSDLSKLYGEFQKHLMTISSGVQNNIPSACSNIVNISNSARSITSNVSPRALFREIEDLSAAFSVMQDAERNPTELSLAKSIVNEFAKSYEAYIASYKASDAVALIYAASNLSSALEKIRVRNAFVIENLENNISEHERQGMAELSLYISSVYGLRDFASKLNAISDLYELIAGLLKISAAESPIVIDQIEAGSLWSKIFGDSRIIGLMIDLLRGSAGFIYRNYTREGQLSTIPGKLESLDKILDLSGRLQAEGVETENIKEELRIATVSIAKNLNKLIDHQQRIEINGESHSIADEFVRRLTDDRWLKPRIAYDDKKDPPLTLPKLS